MKTNARKILSLILSFLMVFGSVAALLPTTVMAAETDATTDFKVFTAEDLFEAVNSESSQNLTFSMYSDENGNAYLRAKPKNSTANKYHIALDFGEAIGDYSYIQVEFDTNIPASDAEALFASYSDAEYKTQTRKFEFLQYASEKYTSNKIFKTASASGELTQWDKFCPWGGTKVLTDYLDDDPGNGKPTLADAYYDIKYIAFFKSVDESIGFNYDKYLKEINKRTITVVVGDEEITIETSKGTTVDLSTIAGLPYRNADGDFLVWTDEDETNIYSDTYEVNGDITLKAKYEEIGVFFTPQDIDRSGVLDTADGGTYNLHEREGNTYYRVTATANTNGHRFILPYKKGIAASEIGAVAVNFITDLRGSKMPFLQFSKKNTSYGKTNSGGMEEYSFDDVKGDDGYYHVNAIYTTNTFVIEGNSTVYGFRFAPWGGDKVTRECFADIRYIATFDSIAAANAFDYDAYKYSLENDRFVTLNTEDDTEYSVTYVAKDGEFTFPGYTPAGDDVVFVGWKSDADETVHQADSKITVTENLTFTAVVVAPVEVKLLDTNGEERVTENVVPGTTVDLSTIAGLPYKNADGYFLVWTDGTNNYSDSYEVTEEITLTAKYEYVDLYSPAVLASTTKGSWGKGNNCQKVGISADGTYYEIKETASSGGKIPFNFTTNVSLDKYVRWVSSTEQGKNKPFIYWDTTSGIETGRSYFSGYGKEVVEDGVTRYYLDEVVPTSGDSGNLCPAEISGLRIVPHGGQTGSATLPVTTRIYYFAFFNSEEAANLFDYDAYKYSLENDRFVTLNTEDDTEYSVTYVAKDGEFTFPGYTPAGDDVIFVGWKSDADETVVYEAGYKLTVTENVSFTAMLVDKFTVTIDLTASVGGEVEYNGETAAKHTITAYAGQTLTFVAVPGADSKFREWHDLTSGHIVVLKDECGIPYGKTLSYTVTGNAVLNANFIPQTSEAPVRLVAFLGRGNHGYITVGNSKKAETYVSAYMSGSSATALKAVAYEGYTPAYWVRFTQDSLTQVLLATGDTVDAYPLGGSVYYQPVFAEENTPVEIYINKDTREIITDPTGYDVVKNTTYSKDDALITVYDCTKSIVTDEDNLLEVYDKNGNIVKEAKNPAYASEWIITTLNDGMKWTMSIGGGEAFDVSYDKEFRFNYMFKDETKVVIRETPVTGSENTDYVIETLASWSANGITNFSAAFDLADGLELVQHGVMMSQNAEDLGNTVLKNNETGIISVADGTIVGKINATQTTSLYTVSKRLANNDDVWYGRAYLIYKNGETTYLVYADDTIPVPAV